MVSQLRCGDIACQWSKKHFILLLVNIENDNVEKVLNRLHDNFSEIYFNSENVNINYRYYEI